MPVTDILIILKVYLVSLALQILGFPIAKKILGKLPDEGYSAGRIFSTLTAAIIIWEAASLGMPVNTEMGLWVVTGLILLLDIFIIAGSGLNFLKISKDSFKIMVLEEYLFAVGLAGVAIIRGFMPNIDTLEKFMDFGFVNSYLYSPTLPANDMWQAGKSINYYSFGHFWASELIRFFRTTPAVGYNMMLAYIAGQSLALSFAISHYLSGAKKGVAGLIAGLTGAAVTVLAGNTHIIWYLIKNMGLKGYWYADATRFIHNTIHEFPSYSFVVADLHGHLLDFPIVLTFILIFLHWLTSRKIIDEIIMGVLFGVMMMTNTWDVAVYGLLMTTAGLFLLVSSKKNFVGLIRSAGVILLTMFLTSLPWFITFQSISSGIMPVIQRSPLWQLLVLWSGGLLVCLASLILGSKPDRKIPINTLVICIVLLIIIPELVYAKDIYPDHPRANTMFKLTYQASIMIGLLFGSVMGRLFDFEQKIYGGLRITLIVLMTALFTGIMIFPAEAFTNFYGNFEKYKGLDGELWLKTEKSERYKIVEYLRNNRDGKNLVEAVGDSYTEFNAISVFSAVPTIQGWRVHEWLWRGGYDSVSVRETDVRNIYEGTNIESVGKILEQYNIGWIVVGEDERITYEVNENLMQELGEVLYFGETYLVKLR